MTEIDNLNEIYEEIILDHSQNPRKTDDLVNVDGQLLLDNPFCGDELKYLIAYSKDLPTKISIQMQGRGCAISLASASLLAEQVDGKTVQEIKEISENLRRLIKGENLTNEEKTVLGDLVFLRNIGKFPARVKCALLSSDVLNQILDK